MTGHHIIAAYNAVRPSIYWTVLIEHYMMFEFVLRCWLCKQIGKYFKVPLNIAFVHLVQFWALECGLILICMCLTAVSLKRLSLHLTLFYLYESLNDSGQHCPAVQRWSGAQHKHFKAKKSTIQDLERQWEMHLWLNSHWLFSNIENPQWVHWWSFELDGIHWMVTSEWAPKFWKEWYISSVFGIQTKKRFVRVLKRLRTA